MDGKWLNDSDILSLLTPSHTPILEKLLHLKRLPYSTLFYIVANFILLCAACRFVVQSSFKKIDQLAWLDRPTGLQPLFWSEASRFQVSSKILNVQYLSIY